MDKCQDGGIRSSRLPQVRLQDSDIVVRDVGTPISAAGFRVVNVMFGIKTDYSSCQTYSTSTRCSRDLLPSSLPQSPMQCCQSRAHVSIARGLTFQTLRL